jgi:glucosamine--fructose-6-phosphate aminotransferase (isomerizing)
LIDIPDSNLRTEILEQPAVLQRLLDHEREHVEHVAVAVRQYNPRYIVMVARGSSDNAARYGQYLFGVVNHLPVALATPSLFTLYGQPPKLTDALVIAISQSGQSPDIVNVVAEGRKQGALTIALTNDVNSPLAHAAAHTINLHAGREKAVAATKTYTTSLMALAMLSSALANDDEHFDQLQAVPAYMEQVVLQAPNTVRLAERYRYINACVVISRGYNYATAFEIALKLKELTYVLAEPYSSADFKHGPVALVERGFPVLAVVPEGVIYNEMFEFLLRLKDTGAELIITSSQPDLLALAQTPLPMPPAMPEWISPMVAVAQGQLFALGLTLVKGLDPDSPRGLQKVTLTE